MPPSAVAGTASRFPETVGPPKIYPVKEARFPGFIEPQPDGYRKAQQAGPDNVAIVIDNGATSACWTG